MTAIVPGMRVQVLIREFPKKPFEDRGNASGALDTARARSSPRCACATRTAPCRPGMYADVKLPWSATTRHLLIPHQAP